MFVTPTLRRPAVVSACLAVALVLGPPAGGAAAPAAKRAPAKDKKPGAAETPGPPIVPEAELWKTLASHKGSAVVLHLWATWCLPCLDELPVVAAFAREVKGKGVAVVSVSLDTPVEEARPIVGRALEKGKAADLGSRILNVADPDAFVARIDQRWDGSLPAAFAYDQQGRLRRAYVGIATRESLEKLVADLRPSATQDSR